MSVRTRYWTHYGYFVLLLLIIATVSILTLRTVGQVIDQIFQEDFFSTLAGRDMLVALDHADTLILNAMVQPVERRSLIVGLEETRQSFLDGLARARSHVSFPGEAESIQRIRQLYATYQQTADSVVATQDDPSIRYVTDLQPLSQAIRREVEAMIVANQEGMQASGKMARATVRERTFLMSMVCALGLLSLFVMSRRFDAHVIQPLRRVRDTVIDMSNGDDIRRPAPLEDGEIGDIARAVTRLADRFDEKTALQQAELETCRRTLHAFIELLPEPAVLLSPAGAIVAFNRAFSERLDGLATAGTVQQLLADSHHWQVLELPQGQGSLYRARG